MLASSTTMAAESHDHLVIHPTGAAAMLVLGHGAGSSMSSPFLQGFCEAIADLGVASYRFDFPYRRAGRRAPDRAPVLIESYREARDRAGTLAGDLPVLAGGRSMGGRIGSMAAAEGMPLAGLVFLAYPLHPPGRPEKIRDAHLYELECPMLFVQGTRDTFAQPSLLESVLSRLGGRAELVSVEGGDHSFYRAGESRDGRRIGASLAPAAADFVHRIAAR